MKLHHQPMYRVSRPLIQRGLTLVELMVAIVLLSIVTLATIALYSLNSRSYRTVDSSQTLDDSARFAFEVIGQAVRNAGYREYVSLTAQADGSNLSSLAQRAFEDCTVSAATEPCVVLGFDNSRIVTVSSNTDFGASGNNVTAANLSDSVALRYFGAGSGNTGDNTVVNCMGIGIPAPTGSGLADVGVSIFSVRIDSRGEPELHCTTRSQASGAWARFTQPIVRGVETFQVAYGVDTDSDSVPNRWVSAVDVPNWQAVRAIRVGMVVRGAPGSAQASTAQTFFPLGEAFTGASAEEGLRFIAPADGRLRRVYTTTFMLRNSV